MKRTEVIVRIEDETVEALDAHLENGVVSFNEMLNVILREYFGLV